ncbi:MAG: hypothetical protein IAE86_06835 [Burkholderiaceae bacterium]|nr:hypothetical protein [Burkholderiaceae bacterium]
MSGCPYGCRERNVMLRRHFAGYPGDHIAPEVFERLEQLLPRRVDSYWRDSFALVLNAVLTAGLDAIDAGTAPDEYTHRGVTLRLQRRA